MNKKTMMELIAILVIVMTTACTTLIKAEETPVAEAPVSFEEAFGAASAGLLYNIQVVIGIAADAFYKDVYSVEEMNNIIGEQKTIIGTLSDYSDKLIKLDKITTSDKQSIGEMKACTEKLNETADALLAYVADPSDDNANAFQDKRKASYDTLSELLGLGK